MTWLYLPITSQPRELDSKLLLAHFARRAGLRPVLGYKSSFLAAMPALQPGVFLAHNARQKVEKLAEVRRFGNAVAVLDEEALVRQDDEIFWKKHNRGAFDHVDKILSWGEDDAALWPRFGVAQHGDVSIVGNPRFDLLRPELASYHAPDVDALRARFGRYVLLNTNFPTVNNLTPQGGGVRMAKWAMDAEGQRLNDRFLDFKRSMFEAELALVAPLAKALAPLSLVVRPHPNEDHGPWRRAAVGAPNAHVVFEGNVVPWLVGAEALIHNNCTTGVEGVAAGKTVLNFVPFTCEFDNPLFHAFGSDGADADALAAAIASGSERSPRDDRDRLRPHVDSVDGALSSDRIARLIASGARGLVPRPGPGRIGRTIAAAGIELKRQSKLLSYTVTASGREKRRFLAQNFPEITPQNLDHEQLRYSKQQLDLMMRQFPPMACGDLDARLARLAAALGDGPACQSTPLDGALIEIV